MRQKENLYVVGFHLTRSSFKILLYNARIVYNLHPSEYDHFMVYCKTYRYFGTSAHGYFFVVNFSGDSGAVKQLLDATQLDPDSKTRYQSRSALHLACGYGQTSVVEELLLVGLSFAC